MEARAWITHATDMLTGISSTPSIDAYVLICDALSQNKAWVLAHPECNITPQQLDTLTDKLHARKTGQPLAYVRGKTEFYGRIFKINPHVLVPRPESETIIELLLRKQDELISTHSEVRIIDIGTGSGALGITATLELHGIEKLATTLIDIDPECLQIAEKNAKLHNVEVELLAGNLLEPVEAGSTQTSTIIIANLPYVPDGYTINNAAEHEPKLALFGGQDGLNLYREMFMQLASFSSKTSRLELYTESLPLQHQTLESIANSAGFRLTTSKDLIQVFSR